MTRAMTHEAEMAEMAMLDRIARERTAFKEAVDRASEEDLRSLALFLSAELDGVQLARAMTCVGLWV